ncbi:unnamed protein product [Sphenostylis stenocarpa]|uniref:Uncharacterized protein n=1 Tax=Sphenostylis stenocarpa TaxID=92480 RepID=A0AA86RKD5_9FABA|nr:unnamed protein product [Sphenostylis stenocarpa]
MSFDPFCRVRIEECGETRKEGVEARNEGYGVAAQVRMKVNGETVMEGVKTRIHGEIVMNDVKCEIVMNNFEGGVKRVMLKLDKRIMEHLAQ